MDLAHPVRLGDDLHGWTGVGPPARGAPHSDECLHLGKIEYTDRRGDASTSYHGRHHNIARANPERLFPYGLNNPSRKPKGRQAVLAGLPSGS